ncbi:MAG: GTPase HflX [Myxococcota bacterium]|nr:GTPase HflX [Myxococcota bacterium]
MFIPDLTRHRAGSSRFRGLRLIRTHLRNEGLTRDDLTDLSLLQLDAIVALQVQTNGLPGTVELGYLNPQSKGAEDPCTIQKIPSVYNWITDFLRFIEELEQDFSKRDALIKVDGRPGAILINVTTGPAWEAQAKLKELERLATTAELQILDRFLQRRKHIDGKFVVGKGKLEQILVRAMQADADVLVFDNELSPSQLRNIALATDLKVIDRTQLILDIFAQRAQSREGKLQVEIAQLRYRKPRIKIMPTAMSRLTGGIGGRGPGETKLEINKRRADERLNRLEKQLSKLSKGRALRRSRRQKANVPQVSLVGYTNAGKSTLLNTMTRSDVDAEDKLFATLDPTSRRFRFPREREIILTDTVGFIRQLPKELVEAFRSTFEETLEADLILHVADAGDPELETHLREVEKTLQSLKAEHIPKLLVFNKIDTVDPIEWDTLAQKYNAILCSAVTKNGLSSLIEEIEQQLFRQKNQGL